MTTKLVNDAVEALEVLKAADRTAADRNIILACRRAGAGHLLDHVTVRHTIEPLIDDDDAIDYLLSRE